MTSFSFRLICESSIGYAEIEVLSEGERGFC
jgi:hypothetical protein